jgi:opacity protein-like surface antigen
MKKPSLFIVTVLATVAAASAGTPVDSKSAPAPSVVEGVGPYVSLFGGGDVYQTADVLQLEQNRGRDLDSEASWLIGLKGGYYFNPPTWFHPGIEFDATYIENEFRTHGRRVESNFSETRKDHQDIHLVPLMVNGLMKFDIGHFHPYLGIGLGGNYTRRDEPQVADFHYRFNDGFEARQRLLSRPHFGHDSNWCFAAQGLAGLEYQCTPHLGFYVEYKALWLNDADKIEQYINHLVTGGVRLYF